MHRLVLDTNIVLDLFVFDDPSARELKAGLEQKRVEWIATGPMRDELERVLGYPHIVSRMSFYQLGAADVLNGFDGHSHRVDVAVKAPVVCSDPDDQKFIDLAVAHKCSLLSKDAAVLSMKKRLAGLDVFAASVLPALSYTLI